ncbi:MULTISPECIES: alpha/beta hydrolase fold domain-containing protein [Lactobacillus]|uniref:Esterase n=1 Tax=Lactobacillus xujianguonis TaxID=2495899 RepID=A0A437SVR6_9LACO|nr:MULTISPECIES: alpha/beta hydrolase fold domain-containing protein [Lactobacillus]RVU71024.1 hypothetical protein EJK17_04780 [Lactobacillus xujianguonis]RVU73906.1 hypothetical protein EJK20_05530 [Lactobacillus xujianguonis]
MKINKIANLTLSAVMLLSGAGFYEGNEATNSSTVIAATNKKEVVASRKANVYTLKGQKVSKTIKKGQKISIIGTKGKYYKIGKNSYIKKSSVKMVTKHNNKSTKNTPISTTGNNTKSVISLKGNDTLTHYDMDGNEVNVTYIPNVPYENYGKQLTLQILEPNEFNHPNKTYPCVMFVKGSHWAKQDVYKNVASLSRLASKGYVVAIVQYRDYDAGFHFPAPIIDAKNAVRFMKANANKYHVQKDNIIMMGGSSGGQVATMAGMTAKTNKFDQPINKENPHVKGIIDIYGAVDLNMKGGFPTTGDSHDIHTPEGSEMGFDIPSHKEETEKANSKNYVNEDFPPMLIAHGTADATVSDKESIELYNALKKAGKPVHLYLINGATHGNNAFFGEHMTNIYDQFIKQCLKK